MSMISSSVLGPQGGGPRRRRPWATAFLVILMMAVIFGGTYGAVLLLRGDNTQAQPDPTTSTTGSPTAVCVTSTIQPGKALPKPAKVTVNVYNATDRSGLAKRTAAELKLRGFGIGQVANDPLGSSLTSVGEIRYGAKGLDAARLLQYYFPGAVLVKDARNDGTVDIALGQKYKAIPKQSTIDKALAKPLVVTTGAGCATATPKATTSGSPKATPSAT